jgi:NAD(P)H-hydrate epimerase
MTREVLSRDAVRELDLLAFERFGIPSIVLMENAARSCIPIALEMMPDADARAIILCGGGNNGGDGLAIARHLHNASVAVRILLAAEPSTPDSRTNLGIIERMGLAITRADPASNGHAALASAFEQLLAAASENDASRVLIIDALLGTGLSQPVRKPMLSLIERVNAARDRGAPVLSIDIPSGLDADTGLPHGAAIRATETITLAALKPGVIAPGASAWTGRLRVGDIGVPRALIRELATRST